jgi:Raf kinase inhibitor-like YbhB/YbcL family protein
MDFGKPRALTVAVIGVGAVLLFSSGCNRNVREPWAPLSIQLTSSSVTAGFIDKASTCDGGGSSPALIWSPPPAGTQTFALVVTDRDSPFGYNFVHWVLYNIPSEKLGLPAAVPAGKALSDGSSQGPNDDGKFGYYPPCPLGHSPHRYDFVVYALNKRVDLPSATKKELLKTIAGHVLAKGELIAKYNH